MATTHSTSRQAGSSKERWPEMGSHHTNMNEMERTFSIVSGAALVLFGLDRLPKTSLLLLAGGLYAIYRGVNGHCQIYEQLGIDHSEHRPM